MNEPAPPERTGYSATLMIGIGLAVAAVAGCMGYAAANYFTAPAAVIGGAVISGGMGVLGLLTASAGYSHQRDDRIARQYASHLREVESHTGRIAELNPEANPSLVSHGERAETGWSHRVGSARDRAQTPPDIRQ